MIKFPLTCITNAQRQAFCQEAHQLLREEANIMGEWYHPDKPLIPIETYQKLRAEVQIRWPYTGEKLSQVEWDAYQDERFMPKSKIIGQGITEHRAKIFAAKPYSVNLDDDIING